MSIMKMMLALFVASLVFACSFGFPSLSISHVIIAGLYVNIVDNILILEAIDTIQPNAISGCAVVSEEAFIHHNVGGRRLFQAITPCPVNFGNQNYSIITSQCKGPTYNASLCCNAFKEFACPFAQYINNETTNCASTMFSYINVYGHYPPGLFANYCREGKEGLACDAEAPSPSDTSGAPDLMQKSQISLHLAMLVIVQIALLVSYQL